MNDFLHMMILLHKEWLIAWHRDRPHLHRPHLYHIDRPRVKSQQKNRGPRRIDRPGPRIERHPDV